MKLITLIPFIINIELISGFYPSNSQITNKLQPRTSL